jgi:hypothetical protein
LSEQKSILPHSCYQQKHLVPEFSTILDKLVANWYNFDVKYGDKLGVRQKEVAK